MAVLAVAVAPGDIIKYQSFVYGSFVWEIHVRYNNIKYQSFVYGSFVWEIHVRYNKCKYYVCGIKLDAKVMLLHKIWVEKIPLFHLKKGAVN